MTESLPTILLPEANDPSIKAFQASPLIQENIFINDMELADAYELLNKGEVDAVIAGASHTTADVLRQAFKDIGTTDGLASSFFMLEREDEEPFFFADCAVVPEPTPEQLAKIAAQTCESIKKLGYEAVVAFLSFSTYGSANLPHVHKIQEATRLFRLSNPGIQAYGEVQFDAAWDERIFEKKTGQTFIGNVPNVFIFPDLNSANISYKIAQLLGGYTAIGPILQGFKRPVYDLSRGVDSRALSRICQIVTELNMGQTNE